MLSSDLFAETILALSSLL